ncbi:MAG: hypothetical protein GY835_05205, partial [bacterium]|nr:hypothetical protein [bacterium]
MAIFCKGDLFQLIKNAGGFEQNSALWDSPFNLQRMVEMQDNVLAHRNQLGAITRLYGGLVTGQYAAPGGLGTAGQPRKFYAPLPQLDMLVLFADEDVDTMINWHFKVGMPRLELGQFMIAHGADVDMSKVGRQMLQSRERGAQRMELPTGRRGVTTALDQINTYHSIVGSELGDPVPLQQLPTTMDEVVPPTAATAFADGFFKQPRPPVNRFYIDRPAAEPLTKPMPRPSRGASPAGSAVSSLQAGETAADVAKRVRTESLSPGIEGEPRDRHESRDPMKKMTPASMAVGRGISPASFEGDDWPRKTATPPVKKMGRGRFDA